MEVVQFFTDSENTFAFKFTVFSAHIRTLLSRDGFSQTKQTTVCNGKRKLNSLIGCHSSLYLVSRFNLYLHYIGVSKEFVFHEIRVYFT